MISAYFLFRKMAHSYHCGSSRKIHIRGLIHNNVPLYDWTLSHSSTVSQWDTLSLRPPCFHVAGITTFVFCVFCRQNGLGYTAFLARLGVSVSPLVVLSEEAWHLLPACIYCAVALGSGVIASLLPETLNAQLPEFIEDIEKTR